MVKRAPARRRPRKASPGTKGRNNKRTANRLLEWLFTKPLNQRRSPEWRIGMRLFVILLASAALAWGQASQPLRLERTIELPEVQGRIDHLSVDVKGQRLFVSALGNNTVEVIDIKAGKRVKTISGLQEPQGVLYVSATDRLYVANAKDGSVRIFNGSSYALLKTVVLCCDPKAFTHTNPLDGMAEGGCLVWESDEEGEQAWEQLPLWARKQIIDKKIRVFTLPGFEIARKATDRADLQLRMQGNAFLGAFFAVSPLLAEFGITPGAVPRGRPQAVREEVRPARRSGREVEHGSHDAGLRARQGNPRRRARGAPTAPRCAARRCCRSSSDGSGDGGCARRLPFRTPIPPARTSARRSRESQRSTPSSAPGYGYNQPATPLRVDGRHCRGHRRHRVEVRRPPRDAALHSRELHAVHGVHLGLPGHRAAQLLAGSGDGAAHGGHALRHRSGRAPEDAAVAAGDREAHARR